MEKVISRTTSCSAAKWCEYFQIKYGELNVEFQKEKSQAEKLCEDGEEIRNEIVKARENASAIGDRTLKIALKVMKGTV